MSQSVANSRPRVPHTCEPALDEVLKALDGLEATSDPAEMFRSVAQLCAPLLCDEAVVTLNVAGQRPVTAIWPPGSDRSPVDSDFRSRQSGRPSNRRDGRRGGSQTIAQHALTEDAAFIPIVVTDVDEDGFHGELALRMSAGSPTTAHLHLGQLVVDRACWLVRDARTSEAAKAAALRADNLERAVGSNREIGIALGILMDRRKLTSSQAFELLRRASQNGHRKLHDVALDIIESGSLEALQAGPTSSERQSRTHIAVPAPPPRPDRARRRR
jgi:hypothetical protein